MQAKMPEETKDALSITAGSKIQILHSKEDKKKSMEQLLPGSDTKRQRTSILFFLQYNHRILLFIRKKRNNFRDFTIRYLIK